MWCGENKSFFPFISMGVVREAETDSTFGEMQQNVTLRWPI